MFEDDALGTVVQQLAGGGQVKRVGPLIVFCDFAFDRAALHQFVDQRDEVCALDTKLVANAHLNDARIHTHQLEDREKNGSQFEIGERRTKVVHHASRREAKMEADKVPQHHRVPARIVA